MSIENVPYRAHAKATGAREGRAVAPEGGLDLKLTRPKALGERAKKAPTRKSFLPPVTARALPVQCNSLLVWPHLSKGRRGPARKLSAHAIFNYILQLLYLGRQWKELPIDKDRHWHPEIHYTRIYRAVRRWGPDGCFDALFEGSVCKLHQDNRLDRALFTAMAPQARSRRAATTSASAGTRRSRGCNFVALCDRNCNLIAPFVSAPGNRNESPLLREALPQLTCIAG